jgi:hypothetical protein
MMEQDSPASIAQHFMLEEMMESPCSFFFQFFQDKQTVMG